MLTEGKLSVYESIVARIKRYISIGLISDGEKLPSCRELALQLGINPNTVQRAYATLEEQGAIYTIPKKGVYAKSDAPSDVEVEAERYVRELKTAGMTREQLERVADKVFGDDETYE